MEKAQKELWWIGHWHEQFDLCSRRSNVIFVTAAACCAAVAAADAIFPSSSSSSSAFCLSAAIIFCRVLDPEP